MIARKLRLRLLELCSDLSGIEFDQQVALLDRRAVGHGDALDLSIDPRPQLDAGDRLDRADGFDLKGQRRLLDLDGGHAEGWPWRRVWLRGLRHRCGSQRRGQGRAADQFQNTDEFHFSTQPRILRQFGIQRG